MPKCACGFEIETVNSDGEPRDCCECCSSVLIACDHRGGVTPHDLWEMFADSGFEPEWSQARVIAACSSLYLQGKLVSRGGGKFETAEEYK